MKLHIEHVVHSHCLATSSHVIKLLYHRSSSLSPKVVYEASLDSSSSLTIISSFSAKFLVTWKLS